MNDEVLVVGYRSQDASPRWPTVARVPPDVLVLRAGPEDLAAIAKDARLAMARRPGGGVEVVGDPSALEVLDEGARLFVAAWRERPVNKPGRPGDGLSWDHPGFEPPDRPRSPKGSS